MDGAYSACRRSGAVPKPLELIDDPGEFPFPFYVHFSRDAICRLRLKKFFNFFQHSYVFICFKGSLGKIPICREWLANFSLESEGRWCLILAYILGKYGDARKFKLSRLVIHRN